ncbi:hypothetical protein EDB92DRAFT_1488046 [Lactarius akahatsu]|uniref:Uncharacterized protein n=1 Tax=Lactarius akahatsu TaxID=416441 RepID=A0AAD4QAG0_9AGAM|nr:hypothetical protein EDB92DRAFT_1488046 [Lactarius akahatsu]
MEWCEYRVGRCTSSFECRASPYNEDGEIPLITRHVRVKVIRGKPRALLLEHGADANSQPPQLVTPMHCVWGGYMGLVCLLLRHSTSVQHVKSQNNYRPQPSLHRAVREDTSGIAALIPEHGADPNTPNTKQ